MTFTSNRCGPYSIVQDGADWRARYGELSISTRLRTREEAVAACEGHRQAYGNDMERRFAQFVRHMEEQKAIGGTEHHKLARKWATNLLDAAGVDDCHGCPLCRS